jgi:riboflavin transporter FmnP
MKQNNLNSMIKISLLSVMAFALMFMDMAVPIFPSFLKIDLSDIPALLGAFALGPAAGIGIELFKNILILIFKGTQTGFVGEAANFIVGALLVGTAGTIYKANKSKKTAIIGLIAGTVVMSVVASALNYTVLLPLYAKVYKMPVDAFVAMGTAINPAIKDMKDFILWSILPFNLLKGIVVSAITIPVYKRISPVLHKEDVVGDSKKGALEN